MEKKNLLQRIDRRYARVIEMRFRVRFSGSRYPELSQILTDVDREVKKHQTRRFFSPALALPNTKPECFSYIFIYWYYRNHVGASLRFHERVIQCARKARLRVGGVSRRTPKIDIPNLFSLLGGISAVKRHAFRYSYHAYTPRALKPPSIFSRQSPDTNPYFLPAQKVLLFILYL